MSKLRPFLAISAFVTLLVGTEILGVENEETSPSAISKSKRPNVLLILADDLGYGELGNKIPDLPKIPTPNIDSISRGGVRFSQGYVTASFCSPSRAGLLTGRNQVRFGFLRNPVGAKNDEPDAGLPLSERTIADHLRDAGYVTGLTGKWHLGGRSKFHPLRRGFDEFYGFLHEGHFYLPPPYTGAITWLRRRVLPGNPVPDRKRLVAQNGNVVYSNHMRHNEPAYDANNPILRGGQPVDEKQFLTDAITREAISFVQRNSEQPWFLYLSYNAVHSPLQGSHRYYKKFSHIKDVQRRIFSAMLANLDEGVGKVLDAVEEAGDTQNTIVFFLSDNGGPTRELTSSNYPLRGEKGSAYEGGLRVPFLMKWPGQVQAGSSYDHPVSSLDIFATVMAATDQKPRKLIDGVDLIPFLNQTRKGRPHDVLFWKSPRHTSLRSGDLKIIKSSTRNGEETLELYDLAEDPAESRNLSISRPDLLQKMQEKMTSTQADQLRPYPGD